MSSLGNRLITFKSFRMKLVQFWTRLVFQDVDQEADEEREHREGEDDQQKQR